MTAEMSDRSAALLSELQAVCQRILTADTRASPGSAALTTMASVANGTAVASSLDALRRQCADNHDQVAELKRSIDGHRGVIAGDSAANGKMLVDLGRAVTSLTEAVHADRRQHGEELTHVGRSVEALRVGLSGFSASTRQQASDLRSSVESLQDTVRGFGEQVQHALTTMGAQIQTALVALSEQITHALRESAERTGQALSDHADARTAALAEGRQELAAAGDRLGEQMAGQAEAFHALTDMLDAEPTRQRLDALESLLSVGLPKFSEDIQAGVQATLLEVSRTFQLAEREHGNRMAELHRDFDTTTRRLEASLEARRRDRPEEPA